MTEHDKVEHELPNGDLLVQDSNKSSPEIDESFRKAEEAVEQIVRDNYDELRAA